MKINIIDHIRNIKYGKEIWRILKRSNLNGKERILIGMLVHHQIEDKTNFL